MTISDYLLHEFKTEQLRRAIDELLPGEKEKLAAHLGITYFTLMGKKNRKGNFSNVQLDKAERWLDELRKKDEHRKSMEKQSETTGNQPAGYDGKCAVGMPPLPTETGMENGGVDKNIAIQQEILFPETANPGRPDSTNATAC